jgi:hypothetical protein
VTELVGGSLPSKRDVLSSNPRLQKKKKETETYVTPADIEHRPSVHLLGFWDGLPTVLNFPAANLKQEHKFKQYDKHLPPSN